MHQYGTVNLVVCSVQVARELRGYKGKHFLSQRTKHTNLSSFKHFVVSLTAPHAQCGQVIENGVLDAVGSWCIAAPSMVPPLSPQFPDQCLVYTLSMCKRQRVLAHDPCTWSFMLVCFEEALVAP